MVLGSLETLRSLGSLGSLESLRSLGIGLGFYQHGGIGGDAFLAAGEAEFLCGGGLDADVLHVYAHTFGQTFLHGGDVGLQFRTLGADGGVYVAYAVSLAGNDIHGTAQEDLAVYVLELRTGVGKVVTDVAHVGGAKQGIADGMYEHIGITVAQKALGVLQADASKPEVAAFYKLVYVESESYSDFHG